MSAAVAKELPAGIYCPTVTFFKDTKAQELDLEAHDKHMAFLANAGLDGVVVQGSTGEAVALNREERKQLIKGAKEAFRRVGNPGAIIAGTVGAQSTREAIELSVDAAEAGADYTLVLPPSYFPALMTPDAIKGFYEEVATASPIPLLIYSYPGVSSGINMDTDLIMALARHPNIAGIKHTDHDIGKITRESAEKNYGSPFTVLGGASDYLLGSLAVGGDGAITGMANVSPRACAKAFELYKSGQYEAALKIAGAISKGEFSFMKGANAGTKWATAHYGGFPESSSYMRRPILPCSEATKKHIELNSADVVAIERQLEKDGYVGLGLRGGLAALATPATAATNGTEHKSSINGFVENIKAKVAAL